MHYGLASGWLGFLGCHRASYAFQADDCTPRPERAVLTCPRPPAQLLLKIVDAPHRSPRNSKLRLSRIRPMRSRAVVSSVPASVHNLPILQSRSKRLAGLQRVFTLPAPASARHCSKGIALVIALLMGLYGGHRFCLGYRGWGIASIGLALLVPYLFFIGGIAGNSLAGILLMAGLGIWLSVDIIRISTNALKPKDGEYYPRLFQTRPKLDALFTE